MLKGTMLAAAVTGALALAGCDRQPEAAAQPSAAATEAEAVAAIRATEAQFNRDYAAHNLEALLAHYTSDATIKAPGLAVMAGRQLRRGFEGAMRDPAFGMTFTNQRTDVAASGDLAYSRGQYVMRWTENGQVQTQHGSYIKVWQRQPDGRWKAAEELTSQGPRPPPTM